MLLDPFSYPNTRARLTVKWRKLKGHLANGTAISKLLQIARRQVRTTDTSGPKINNDVWNDLRPKPDRGVFARSLVNALQDNRKALIVYTSFASELHNYPGQLQHVHPELRALDGIDVALLPEADHTYSRLFMQEQLAASLLPWLTQNFGTTPLQQGES